MRVCRAAKKLQGRRTLPALHAVCSMGSSSRDGDGRNADDLPIASSCWGGTGGERERGSARTGVEFMRASDCGGRRGKETYLPLCSASFRLDHHGRFLAPKSCDPFLSEDHALIQVGLKSPFMMPPRVVQTVAKWSFPWVHFKFK